MAESIAEEQDQVSCPVCLDLLKDPVTIPCGHSYCMDCIKGCWDQDDQTGVYSCPQCRQTFTPRPVLGRNTVLAEVVEKLKKTGLQAAPPAHSVPLAHCYAGPGDVACDVCTGKKRKAVKSCLQCLASYCETDLILHDKLNQGKSHKMIEVTEKLQEKICSHHAKLLEAYCPTNKKCICLLCAMDEHRGNETVSAAAEMTEKQDPTHKITFTPEIDHSKGKITYRYHSAHAVHFQCSVTGLVFVMEMVVEVQYSTALWDSNLLTPTGQQPAGPLFNITCPQGSMRELHLPHCEVLSGKRCDFLSVAHVVGDSIEVLQPLEVTDTHVKVKISSFSLFGLIKSPSHSSIKGQVLLFLRQPGGDILNVLLLPRNIPISEVEPQQRGGLHIQVSSNCTLTPDRTYKLSCDNHRTQPKDAPFDCEYSPNYHPTFEVFLDMPVWEMNLRLLEWGFWWSEVWARLIRLPAPPAPPLPADSFIDQHMDELIQRVTQVEPIADTLLSKGLIQEEAYSKIRAAQPRQGKMRELLNFVRAGAPELKSTFYTLLKEKESYLVKHLGKTDCCSLSPCSTNRAFLNLTADTAAHECSKMAASISVEQDQFSCSICLDLLKDPVAIPCGHSYCMDCIKGCWDQDDQTGVYSCPQCRQTFAPRPVLGRNTILAEVVEKLKKTGLQAAPPAHCYAGPGDVACDVCTERKRKAVKFCLVCLASYCETDLMLHDKVSRGKVHKLVDATGKLQDKICPRHDKLLEIYCRTDQRCICYLCTMDEHRGHDTVSAAAERTEKQKHLGATQKESQQKIQEREKELQDLRQAVESLTRSAQAAVEDSERIFTELVRSIERRRSEVKELIRDQEKAAVSQAEGVIKRLELEIAELRRRDAELEQLSHTEDHIHFLQNFQSLCVPAGCGDFPSIAISPNVSFEFMKKSFSELKDAVEETCKQASLLISQKVKVVHIVQPPEPSTRADFLKYSCELTLDPNTAHRLLHLSEGHRKVVYGAKDQPYPDLPERFDLRAQVLCREGLAERCYWEAEWSGGDWVCIALSYKGISRKGSGNDCHFGRNEKSWRLFCSASSCSFWHNNKKTEIPVPSSSRVGVYLDHRAGTLSFYSVSDTMTLLHRVQTTFTQPLYPGFLLSSKSSVKLRLL
ncbi:uncharacterized protein LOC118771499 [Megalops cyprinoides]|uniref:uncharacterized protein LOC118771499 n=1 Tax=Megalops cyprinoides TaxID=118141 RepID=UPI0018654DEE|nr:uncharacterized protein LOC118771499 [Megalops cyprinoides]